MYKSEPKSPTYAIRTCYSQKKKRGKISRVKSPDLNNNNDIYSNSNNDNNNNYYRVINGDQNYKYIIDPWSALYSKQTKDREMNIKPRKNKNNISSNSYLNNNGEKRHFMKSSNYDLSTKTQITTLPGGVKRNKYEIKDDMYFKKPYNQSRLYKMINDYNLDLNNDHYYDPITQGYNVNIFPTQQRFYGSYKRGMKDHDIFNTNFNSGFNYRFYNK